MPTYQQPEEMASQETHQNQGISSSPPSESMDNTLSEKEKNRREKHNRNVKYVAVLKKELDKCKTTFKESSRLRSTMSQQQQDRHLSQHKTAINKIKSTLKKYLRAVFGVLTVSQADFRRSKLRLATLVDEYEQKYDEYVAKADRVMHSSCAKQYCKRLAELESLKPALQLLEADLESKTLELQRVEERRKEEESIVKEALERTTKF